MGKGLGSNQEAVMPFITSDWKSTGEIATDYGITASDKTQYRSLIASLDGLQNRGHIAKEHRVTDNARVISMWKLVAAPAKAKPSKRAAPPVAKKAPSKKAAPPKKAVSKAPPDRRR